MHFKQRILKISFSFLALLFLVACASRPVIQVEPLPGYDALFERQAGWTGADGVYSVPLSDRKILWLFGDTWWGDVRNNVHVNATIVNNTVAIQNGRLPQEAAVEFYAGRTPDGSTAAFIRPADGRGWLWIYHGAIIREHLYLFLVQIERTAQPPAAGFKIIGTWLGQVPNFKDPPQHWQVSRQKIPWGNFSSAATLFGSWLLKEEQWIYIYGTTEDVVEGFHHKYMILARAPQNALSQFNQWRFYANGRWSADFRKAERLCAGVANEYSVSFLPAMGKYIAVYSDSEKTDNIVVRVAPMPWGPWDDPVSLFRCPEANWGPDIICYAAKGHPGLSAAPNELIISYIANSTDFETMVSDARLYRPRFIRVEFRRDAVK